MPKTSMVALATHLAFYICGCSAAQSEKPPGHEDGTVAPQSERDATASARKVIRDAISYLEHGEARRVVVEMTHPDKLKALESEGRLKQIVARFEGSWGRTLLSKLRDAVQDRDPTIRENGDVEFSVSGALGPMSHPIVLGESSGRWYFVE